METPNFDGVTAIILAGGEGTRVAAIFPNLPKPLIPAAGAPFLYWVVSWLFAQGLRDIVISTGHLGHLIESWVADTHMGRKGSLRCRREGAALGTGGAVRYCLDDCADELLILNGDTLLLADLSEAVIRFRTENLSGLLLAKYVPDSSRYGTLIFRDGILTEIREKFGPGPGHVYGGIAIFRRAALEDIPVGINLSLETEVLPHLLAQKVAIGVSVVNAPFLDIGTEDSVRLGDRFVKGNKDAFDPVWSGSNRVQIF
jgi:D-glycero-alpha-D-manno-heptose 1-phosphate guanylyltransferase